MLVEKELLQGAVETTLEAQHFKCQSKVLVNFVQKELINEQEAAQLTEDQIANLQPLAIRRFIEQKQLSVQQASQLTSAQRGNLMSLAVIYQIFEGNLSIQKALDLTFEQRRAIQDKFSREQRASGQFYQPD